MPGIAGIEWAESATISGALIILLHVIARGKIARSPEAELVARYEKRLTWPVKFTELPETGGRIPEPQTPYKTVLLDERGKDLPSEDLADILGRWRDDGMRECRFILGAADGHSEDERSQAELSASLTSLEREAKDDLAKIEVATRTFDAAISH